MTRTTALRIGRELELPPDAVTQTFAVLGKRGSGKTNMGVVLVEEMVAHGLPVVVVDPVGVWWGLRAASNGEDRGLPVILLGGEHADVPLESTSGAVIADFLVESGKACVLDVSGMRKAEQTRFMTDFAERLYQRKARHRDPLHLVVDEADAFAPQRAMPDQARLLGAMEDLVRRGRSRGVGMTMITQRLAVLNKNVLTQAEVLVVFQLTAPQDRSAIAEWVRANADTSKRAELDAALPGLPQGHAFVWSPSWLNVFQRVAVRARTTFDSSRTPEAGKAPVAPRELAAVDIEALKAKIAATREPAKGESAEALRARVAKLEAALAGAKALTTEVEVPVLSEADLARLASLVEGFRPSFDALTEAFGAVAAAIARASAKPLRGVAAAERAAPKEARDAPVEGPPKRAARDVTAKAVGAPALRAGERRMLETLVRHHPMRMTRTQVGTLAGFTASGGTFKAYLGTLLRAGYVVEQAGLVAPTEAGLVAGGGGPRTPQSAEETLALWRKALRSGERAMLDALLAAHPAGLSRLELGRCARFEPEGGTFKAYLGTLRRNGLVDETGGRLHASAMFFVDGTPARR